MSLFGKKNTGEKTVAIFDIETGSVAMALVRLTPGQKPKLISHARMPLGIQASSSSEALLRDTTRVLHEALLRASTTAARIRAHAPLAPLGSIDRVALFLHAPWVSVDTSGRQHSLTDAPEELLSSLKEQVRDVFDSTPVSFHAFSTTAAPVIRGLFGAPVHTFVCVINGELAEFSILKDQALLGHATVPAGTHTILRTLATHGGLSFAEARSVLALSARNPNHEHKWDEALSVAAKHFNKEVRDVAHAFVSRLGVENPHHLFVVAPGAAANIFARTLVEDESLTSLFPEGSTVRAVRPQHVSEHFGNPLYAPDVPLTLEALFVDTRFGS